MVVLAHEFGSRLVEIVLSGLNAVDDALVALDDGLRQLELVFCCLEGLQFLIHLLSLALVIHYDGFEFGYFGFQVLYLVIFAVTGF